MFFTYHHLIIRIWLNIAFFGCRRDRLHTIGILNDHTSIFVLLALILSNSFHQFRQIFHLVFEILDKLQHIARLMARCVPEVMKTSVKWRLANGPLNFYNYSAIYSHSNLVLNWLSMARERLFLNGEDGSWNNYTIQFSKDRSNNRKGNYCCFSNFVYLFFLQQLSTTTVTVRKPESCDSRKMR